RCPAGLPGLLRGARRFGEGLPPARANAAQERWIDDELSERVDEGHVNQRQAAHAAHVDAEIEAADHWHRLLLRHGSERRDEEAERENDREPDPPLRHFGDGGSQELAALVEHRATAPDPPALTPTAGS